MTELPKATDWLLNLHYKDIYIDFFFLNWSQWNTSTWVKNVIRNSSCLQLDPGVASDISWSLLGSGWDLTFIQRSRLCKRWCRSNARPSCLRSSERRCGNASPGSDPLAKPHFSPLLNLHMRRLVSFVASFPSSHGNLRFLWVCLSLVLIRIDQKPMSGLLFAWGSSASWDCELQRHFSALSSGNQPAACFCSNVSFFALGDILFVYPKR